MLHPRAAQYSRRTLYFFEGAGLIVIALATIYAGYQETLLMINNARVTLADLLLMFLYLEILTMVGLYFESGKLPVRFPLYIAMVAMAPGFILGQLCDYVDLDGPHGLVDDPFASSIYSDGEVFVPESVWGLNSN